MGKVVTSGLHPLKELFGESVFDLSQELQRLRTQLQMLGRHYNVAKELQCHREPFWKFLLVFEIIALTIGLAFAQSVSEGSRRSEGFSAILTLLILGGGIGTMLLTYKKLIVKPKNETLELAKHYSDLKSQIQEHTERYAGSITERLRNLTTKRGEVGRTARRGDSAWLFYCPSYTAMLDLNAEEIMLVNTLDCRDVQLSYKEIERRSVAAGTVKSAVDRSLTGAAIGGLIFGSAGMVAGSVIGSAGERKLSVETIEMKVGKYLVDLYTRLQDLPVVTLEFDDDERLAKEFYAVVSAALAGPA